MKSAPNRLVNANKINSIVDINLNQCLVHSSFDRRLCDRHNIGLVMD